MTTLALVWLADHSIEYVKRWLCEKCKPPKSHVDPKNLFFANTFYRAQFAAKKSENNSYRCTVMWRIIRISSFQWFKCRITNNQVKLPPLQRSCYAYYIILQFIFQRVILRRQRIYLNFFWNQRENLLKIHLKSTSIHPNMEIHSCRYNWCFIK